MRTKITSVSVPHQERGQFLTALDVIRQATGLSNVSAAIVRAVLMYARDVGARSISFPSGDSPLRGNSSVVQPALASAVMDTITPHALTREEKSPGDEAKVLSPLHPRHPNQRRYTLAERWVTYLQAQPTGHDKLEALAEMADELVGIPVSEQSKRELRRMAAEITSDGSPRGSMAVADGLFKAATAQITGDKIAYMWAKLRGHEKDRREWLHQSRPQAESARAWSSVRPQREYDRESDHE